MAEKDIFQNITPPKPMDKPDESYQDLRGKKFEVGTGDKATRADERGFWMGATNPEDAPFYIDTDGNVTIKGAGGAKFKIDSQTGSIIINDGRNDRILIGFEE